MAMNSEPHAPSQAAGAGTAAADIGRQQAPRAPQVGGDGGKRKGAGQQTQEAMSEPAQNDRYPDAGERQSPAAAGQNYDKIKQATQPCKPRTEPVPKKFERLFGHDFSQVCIHYGTGLPEKQGAQAFTQGKRIYVADAAPKLDSAQGGELLGHELTHVVQQNADLPSAAGCAPADAGAGGAASGADDGHTKPSAQQGASAAAPGGSGPSDEPADRAGAAPSTDGAAGEVQAEAAGAGAAKGETQSVAAGTATAGAVQHLKDDTKGGAVISKVVPTKEQFLNFEASLDPKTANLLRAMALMAATATEVDPVILKAAAKKYGADSIGFVSAYLIWCKTAELNKVFNESTKGKMPVATLDKAYEIIGKLPQSERANWIHKADEEETANWILKADEEETASGDATRPATRPATRLRKNLKGLGYDEKDSCDYKEKFNLDRDEHKHKHDEGGEITCGGQITSELATLSSTIFAAIRTASNLYVNEKTLKNKQNSDADHQEKVDTETGELAPKLAIRVTGGNDLAHGSGDCHRAGRALDFCLEGEDPVPEKPNPIKYPTFALATKIINQHLPLLGKGGIPWAANIAGYLDEYTDRSTGASGPHFHIQVAKKGAK